MNTEQVLVFRPSKGKLVGMLLGCAAFVVAGTFMVRAGEWAGWAAIVFFGLGVAVFTLQLLPNSTYLRLGPDGFTVCTLFRAHSCRWSDVEPFEVRQVATKQMVVFSFSKQYRGSRRLSGLNVRLVGAEAAVAAAGSWSVSMDELAAVLNRFRERYRAV